MSELDELLRQHTESVNAALSGFEGQITTINDALQALTNEARRQPDPTRLAVSRLNGPVMGFPAGPGEPSRSAARERLSGFGMADRRSLSMPDEARTEMVAIMRGAVTSAMREASDPDGGYLVPEVIAAQIEDLVLRQSPIRRVARVVDFSTSRVVLPVNMRGATAGWVGEDDERVETDTPELAAVAPPGGTLYALPKASEELVDDAMNNLEQFIEENVVDAFAEAESEAFIRGNGIKKPAGFLAPDRPPSPEADAVRPLGTLQYIAGGHATQLDQDQLQAVLVRLLFSMKAGYRQAPGTAWLASTDLISKFAMLKDGEGRPIYIPSLREGVPGTLLGHPVMETEHMDSVGADAFPLAFGNWQRGYVIGDRTGFSVLRDPYTTKGQVKWYFRKRVHGSVLNSEAIKLLKIAVPA